MKINSPFIAVSIIILSAAFAIVSFSDYSFQLNQTFEEDMQTGLAADTRQTDDLVNNKFKDVVSSMKELSRTIASEAVPLNDDRVLALLDEGKVPDDSSIMTVALPDGTCYVSDGRKTRVDDRPYFTKAMANNIVISNVPQTKLDGSNCMVITVPVYRNFQVVGAISTVLNMETVNKLLGSQKSDAQGIACIVEKSGKIIAASLPQYVNQNIFSIASISYKNQSTIDKIKTDTQADKSGSLYYYFDKGERFAYYTPVGINDWYFVNTMPTNMATIKLSQILQFTGLLAAKIAVVLILLAIYFTIYAKRSKKALRLANEGLSRTKIELETFVANLPGGAFRYSADEKAEIQFVSDGLLRMFGLSKEEFNKRFGNVFYNMICEEDRVKTIKNIELQAAKGNFVEVKYRIVTADGRIRWVLNRAQVVTHGNGYSEFCAVVVDITESKQAHKRASDAMAQLQMLSNSISGGVAQFLYEGGNLTLMYASEGFYKLSGQTKEEYARHNKSSGVLCAYSEDQAGLQSTINRQIAKQAPLDAEYRLIQKDGNLIWISLSGTPTVNRYNQIIYQCIFNDITSFKRTQEELEQERERYQIAENLSDDIMFEYNIATDNMKFSPLFTALTGRNPNFPNYSQKIEQNDSICSMDLPALKEFFEEIQLGHSDAGAEFRFKTKNGEYIWHQLKAKVVYDTYGKPLTAVGKAYNIDEQKIEMQRLTDKSQRDGLTNLYNKVSTQSQIEDDLKDLGGGGKHALIIIDIDNFKSINDSFGHLVGDGVIKDISAKIQVLFRTSDVVGRIGGDEFVVFLRGVSSDNMVIEKAKAICDIFRSAHPADHAEYQISASLGIAMYPDDGTTYQALFPKADLALYRAKRLGKDCYAFYCDQLDATPNLQTEHSDN